MNLPDIKKICFPLFGLWIILLFLYFSAKTVSIPQVTSFGEKNNIPGFEISLPTPAPYPKSLNLTTIPLLSAKGIYIIDVNSMVVLYEKNSEQKFLPASTTKIMTALISMENYSLDSVLEYDGGKIDGNVIGLLPKEKMSVGNLLNAMLVGSGNDAAYVLAANSPGGYSAFVDNMNKRASELNLINTHFTNPMGFDEDGHFSTAKDLALLSIEALKNPVFTGIVSMPETIVTDITGQKIYKLKNTNELLGELPYVKGIKTGWTENAKECLVSFLEKDNHKIISVLLDSDDRARETKLIAEWIYTNFLWQFTGPRLSFR